MAILKRKMSAEETIFIKLFVEILPISSTGDDLQRRFARYFAASANAYSGSFRISHSDSERRQPSEQALGTAIVAAKNEQEGIAGDGYRLIKEYLTAMATRGLATSICICCMSTIHAGCVCNDEKSDAWADVLALLVLVGCRPSEIPE